MTKFVAHFLLAVLCVVSFNSEAVEPILLQIIADPARYEGQTVQVTGYCVFEFEGTNIYLSRDDHARRMSSRLWLDTPPDPKRGPYDCIVEGVVDAKAKGHMNTSVGTIKSIKRLQRWQP